MAAGNWKPFPDDADAYRYEGAALWGELHRGDGEPVPDAVFVR